MIKLLLRREIFNIVIKMIIVICLLFQGAYNRTSRPAVPPAKIYLARPLQATVLLLHRLLV